MTEDAKSPGRAAFDVFAAFALTVFAAFVAIVCFYAAKLAPKPEPSDPPKKPASERPLKP